MQPTSRPDPSSSSNESSPALFLRMPSVVRMTGLCRSTIYRLISENKFPAPVRVGDRAVAWRPTDIHRWSEERPASAPAHH
jgi:prophage regulatory protein